MIAQNRTRACSPTPHPPAYKCMQILRGVATMLQPLGPRVLYYLAAAVSDFYLPWSEMVCAGAAYVSHSARLLLGGGLCNQWVQLPRTTCRANS